MLTLNRKFLMGLTTLVVLLFSFALNNSYAIVQQSREFYVNDSANVLSTSTKEYIVNINNKLYAKTGAQIVVVTVNNLDGKSIEEYSTELFRSYGIGDNQKNNGVLFLVSIEDRKTRIEVGYGLEGVLTDGKTGRILDNYVVSYFSESNWNDGIKNGFDAILKEVCTEYDITIDAADSPVYTGQADELSDVQYLTAFIVFITCLISRHIFSRTPLLKWGVGIRNSNCCYYY